MLSRFKFVVVVGSTFLAALLVLGAALGERTSADGAYRQLSVYTEVLSKIKSDYVEDPDIKRVTRGALAGLLESLDPYSCYLTADQYKDYEKRRASPAPGGVGLVLSKRVGIVFVLASLPGSPAVKAGLGVWDQVDAIDGQATRELPLPLAQALLSGPVGSNVTVLVRRSRRGEEPQEITLTRAVVASSTSHRLMEDKVGYLELKTLGPGKAAEAARALRELTSQGAERMVLDLRGNAWGELQEGIKLANLFVDSGLLAYLEGQKSPRKEFSADPRQSISKMPLVVLTNRATAGAAELAVAAIADRQRGQIVGERTFGLAAEQKTLPMDDGAALILSIAKYYRPSGKAIQDGGINPNLLVADTALEHAEEGTAPPPDQPGEKPADEVLKKALEVLKGATVAAAA